jgi:hypothetical protein
MRPDPRETLTLEERLERVERTRADLTATLGKLRGGMGEALSLTSWARRRPLATAGVLAAAGLWLGARLLGRRRRPRLPAAAAPAAPAAAAALGALLGSALLRALAPVLVERGTALVLGLLRRRPRQAGGEEERDEEWG